MENIFLDFIGRAIRATTIIAIAALLSVIIFGEVQPASDYFAVGIWFIAGSYIGSIIRTRHR